MSISQLLYTFRSTTVQQALPTSAALATKGYMSVRNGSGNDMLILGKFPLPGPAAAAYSGTKLRLYNTGAAIPSRTYILKRLTSGFSPTTITYGNKPTSTTSGQVSVTAAVSAAADGGYLEFDISGILNTVSDGSVRWYGVSIELSTTDNTQRSFGSLSAAPALQPIIDATWSTAPLKPTGMLPAGGNVVGIQYPIFSAQYIDRSGSTVLTALQIQIHSTNDFSGAVDFDSGEVATTDPEYDPTTGAWGGIADGATKYWRIMFKDGDGNWSPWSDVVSFTRHNKSTVTIISPAASPNDYVEDVTPPISFSFSGTQKSIQILVRDDAKTSVVFNSGKLTTSDTFVTVSTPPLVNGLHYWLEVRVWDQYNRSTLPNDTAYATAERRFLVTTNAAITGTTDLVLTQVGKLPWVQLDFKRTTPPDFFDIFKNGVVIADNIPPDDLFVSGTDYRFVDRRGLPRQDALYEVRAKVNSQTSATNDTETIHIKPATAYLSTLDGAISIPLLNYVDRMEYSDGSVVVDVLNSDQAITVYQSSSGRRGSFDGILSKELPGVAGTEDAADHLANFLTLRASGNRGRLCVLSYKDQSMVCTLSQLQYSATVYKEEIAYAVSFFAVEKTRVVL